MWIFCSGLQRSGSTVQFQITSEIVERSGRGMRTPHPMGTDFKEFKTRYSNTKMLVFKTHNLTDSIRDEFMNHDAKGVCIYRDIRDVCVSMMNKFDFTFEKLKKDDFIKTYLKEYYEWKAMPAMYMSKYENIYLNLHHEVTQISEHLGIDMSKQVRDSIAGMFSIEKQKKRMFWPWLKAKILKRKSWDKKSQLHWNHINSGEVGQWKSVLSKQEIDYIFEVAGDWMNEHGYEK